MVIIDLDINVVNEAASFKGAALFIVSFCHCVPIKGSTPYLY